MRNNGKSVGIVPYRFVWTWFRVDFSKLDLRVREMGATFFYEGKRPSESRRDISLAVKAAKRCCGTGLFAIAYL